MMSKTGRFVLLFSVLIAVILGVFFWKTIIYLPKLSSCKEQMTAKRMLSGLVSGPSSLSDIDNFSLAGCSYNFKYDDKMGVLNFDILVFDKRGWPFVYGAKIEKQLDMCQIISESVTVCKRMAVNEYKDYPENKMVILGFLNGMVPGSDTQRQPDLKMVGNLKTAASGGNIYPLGLFKKRVWIWSLTY